MKTALFDLENWREIFATLMRNKTRTLLTAFGIFWGTAMLAMLLGGAEGLQRKIMKNFEGFATNIAILGPSRRTISYQGFNKGTTWTLTTDDVEAMRQIAGIEAVATGNSEFAQTVSAGKHGTTATVQGVDQYFIKAFEPKINAGRFINEADQNTERKVAAIGINVANKLFPGQDPIGQFVKVGSTYYRVVGIVSQETEVQIGGGKIDDNVVVPLKTFNAAYQKGNEVAEAMIVAKEGTTPTQLRPKIFRAIRTHHPIHPDDTNAIFFFDISEQFAMVDSLFSGITLLALFVGIGTLIAGVIGVGNIMWVIVKERTQEIGIRRAIGAKPRDIVVQILSEGIALTFFAGTAGVVFAAAVLQVAETLVGVRFQMWFSQAVAICVVFIILGCGVSIIPSLKSMKIKPIEAINDK